MAAANAKISHDTFMKQQESQKQRQLELKMEAERVDVELPRFNFEPNKIPNKDRNSKKIVY